MANPTQLVTELFASYVAEEANYDAAPIFEPWDTPANENQPPPETEPDREQLETFIRIVFRHVAPGGWASVRTFFHDRGRAPFRITAVPLDGDLGELIEIAYHDASLAARNRHKLVFCPPVATFCIKEHAREKDLSEGLVLCVECDQRPAAARTRLEALLGPATLVVESGGEWTDPETGEIEPKLHLYWVLKKPTTDKAEHDRLKEARTIAATLVGGDPSNAPLVHPIRWPGSVHRKGAPKLCRIVGGEPDAEIELDAALAALRNAAGGGYQANGKGPTAPREVNAGSDRVSPGRSDEELQALLELSRQRRTENTAGRWHDSMLSATASMVGRGWTDDQIYRVCAPYCDDGYADSDLVTLVQGAREKWHAPDADKVARAMHNTFKEQKQKQEQKQTEPEAYFLEQLLKLPLQPLQWIVEDFILAEALGGLFGDGGTGKDLLLLQLGIAATCGAKWLGRDVKQGRVMYCPAEDDVPEIRRRAENITRYYRTQGTYDPVPEQFKIVPLLGQDAVLAAYDGKAGVVVPKEGYTTLSMLIEEFRPDLVIVGNRVNIFSVGQNDDAQACQCMALLSALCRTYHTSVLMPSHVSVRGREEGTSGSVQWSNACRLRAFLRRITDDKDGSEHDPTLRQLEVMKANWSATGKIVTMQWHEGVFKPDSFELEHTQRSEAENHGDDEREVLYLLDGLIPGDHVSPKSTANNFVVTKFSTRGRFKHMGRKGRERVQGAIERLYVKGVIKSVEVGPVSRRTSRIERAVK